MTNTELTLDQLQALSGGIIEPSFLTITEVRGVIHPSFCEPEQQLSVIEPSFTVGRTRTQVAERNGMNG